MPADRVHRATIQPVQLEAHDTEQTLFENTPSGFSTRFDPISKRVLFKSRTESQISDGAVGTRANFQLLNIHSSQPNIFARSHALIAHEREVAKTKLEMEMKESLVLAEKEAKHRQFYERKLTRDEMRKKDQQALLRVVFETYVRKWGKLVYPERIKVDEQEGADKGLDREIDLIFPFEEEFIPHLRFVDIPWPVFTAVHSLSQFLEKIKEVTPFLRRPDIHKYLDGVQQKDVWKIQKNFWDPKKFDTRVLRKVVKEDREDVYKAFLRVKEVLWDEDDL